MLIRKVSVFLHATFHTTSPLACIKPHKLRKMSDSDKKYSNEDLRNTILEGFKITFDKILNLKKESVNNSDLNKIKKDIQEVNLKLDTISQDLKVLKEKYE